MIKVLDMDEKLFQLGFCPPLMLESREQTSRLEKSIRNYHIPDIIFIDPIYFAFTGDLIDNRTVRQFMGNLRVLKENLDCALVLVHHTHNVRTNKEGNLIDEGDRAIFGSSFFRAWPDHILLFNFNQKSGLRTLSCTTQRSGEILEKISLKLNQPNPLFFEESEAGLTNEEIVVELLKKSEYKEGLKVEQILEATRLAKSSFYHSIKNPLAEGRILKVNDKPVRYRYVEE